MDSRLDDKDRSILEILQENGDYTTRQIAKRTLLPITTVHNRIQKLKKDGIIKRFTIEVDHSAIDKGFMVYLLVSVNIEKIRELKKTQHDIARELRGFYFIEKVNVVAGGTDIVCVVRVKDVKEYDKVLLTKIQQIEGIKETKSMVAIHGD
jgi:DNA-binding Lrp family transcriptional regulator